MTSLLLHYFLDNTDFNLPISYTKLQDYLTECGCVFPQIVQELPRHLVPTATHLAVKVLHYEDRGNTILTNSNFADLRMLCKIHDTTPPKVARQPYENGSPLR